MAVLAPLHHPSHGASTDSFERSTGERGGIDNDLWAVYLVRVMTRIQESQATSYSRGSQAKGMKSISELYHFW